MDSFFYRLGEGVQYGWGDLARNGGVGWAAGQAGAEDVVVMDVGWRLSCRSQSQQRNTMRQTKLGEPFLCRPERRFAICKQMVLTFAIVL